MVHVLLPRPPTGIRGADVFGKGHFGKAFVQYSSTAEAEAAKAALHGMIFDSRPVTVTNVDEAAFNKALGL